METKLRELMQAVVGDPPHRVTAEAVRHQVVRRRIREAAGVLAVVVLAAVGVTAAVRVLGAGPGPAAHHGPAAPIVYVAYPGKYNSAEMLVPINTVTNTPGKPIRVGTLAGAAFTPDGKTAYVEGPTGAVIPIRTATNSPGKPIPVPMPGYRPFDITMNPDGKAAYLTFSWSIGSSLSGSILPISTATNTAGKPIRVASGTRPFVGGIVFSPDGKTAYAAAGSLAFGGPGTPLATTHLRPAAVIPINTATNTPGTPIRIKGGFGQLAITPDGKTLYAADPEGVIPISTATNTPGTPIRLPSYRGFPSLWITP